MQDFPALASVLRNQHMNVLSHPRTSNEKRKFLLKGRTIGNFRFLIKGSEQLSVIIGSFYIYIYILSWQNQALSKIYDDIGSAYNLICSSLKLITKYSSSSLLPHQNERKKNKVMFFLWLAKRSLLYPCFSDQNQS